MVFQNAKRTIFKPLPTISKRESMIEAIDNKYDGVIVDNTTFPQKKDEF